MPDETIIAIPHPEALIVIDDTETVLVVEEQVNVAVATTPGLQGRPGIQGPAGAGEFTFVHDQFVPAAIWNITHNLNGYPNCATVDSSGREVIGDLEWLDANNIRASFTAAFGGKAYLS